jgi:hypothetical protein
MRARFRELNAISSMPAIMEAQTYVDTSSRMEVTLTDSLKILTRESFPESIRTPVRCGLCARKTDCLTRPQI